MENNFQDQLDRVAKNLDGGEDLEESTVEAGTKEDLKDDDLEDKELGSTQDKDKEPPKELPEDEKKQAGAFAAMRKRLKELEEENKTLKEGTQQKETPPPKEEPPAEETNKEYLELAKRLEELERRNQELQQREMEVRVTKEIQNLTQEFNLTQDDLAKFADEIENRGYDINSLKMPLRDMYVAVNHDMLIKAEVERVKKEIQAQMSPEDNAPSGGPKQTGGKGTKGTSDIRATLARVGSKIQ